MKLRLVLKVKDKKGKDSLIKFNIAPSKHIGCIRFLNYAIENDREVTITFEKMQPSGKREEMKFAGKFKFEGRPKELEEPLEKALDAQKRKKKKK